MRKFLYLIIVVLLMSSCGVKYKSIPYFQDLGDTIKQEIILNQIALKLQKSDILAITVTSLNQDASSIFNMGNTTGGTSSTLTNGFIIDSKGAIQLPLIGDIRVEGFTISEARELIQKKLEVYLKEPVVSLRVVNFKVSVLGDVARPGVFPIDNERVSVADALSLAGDLNITALRKNVLLVRENDGKRQYIRLDMTSKDLFSSPYFYLQNNDVLYIQPGNSKYASVDSSYRNISLILSALSFIAILITRL